MNIYIINDVMVAPSAGNPKQVVEALRCQLDDPQSRLKQGKWTSKAVRLVTVAQGMLVSNRSLFLLNRSICRSLLTLTRAQHQQQQLHGQRCRPLAEKVVEAKGYEEEEEEEEEEAQQEEEEEAQHRDGSSSGKYRGMPEATNILKSPLHR
jgi:hypothetical protein